MKVFDRWPFWFFAGPAVLLAIALSQRAPATEDEPAVTWSRDVAPIVWKNCVPCHRSGQVAPFSLLGYGDAARRAEQIAWVTSRRYMPPWPPVEGYGEFRGERRLSAEEIATLKRWAEAGAPEGDPEHLPPKPEFSSGWRLGEPDRVIEMAEAYTLPADGPDLFRNFVLPLGSDERRYVEAVEFRPDNPRVVHHATILLDPLRRGRELDTRDEAVGFEGMLFASGGIAPPEGHLLAWTPGRVPHRLAEGTWWALPRGSDMVLEAHLLPTGKPERLKARLGLHFADGPPTYRPVLLRLGSESIDIPPGATDYRTRDRFVLPVEVEALSIYPHAHYLGREIKAFATLPDGSQEPLVWIDDWDFNWQDLYEYEERVHLPAGTVIEVEFAYDNSAENYANPNQPPERVRHGPRSSDEMGTLLIQVLAQRSEERERLVAAVEEHWAEVMAGGYEMKLRYEPEAPDLHTELADLLARRGELERAAEHYVRALEVGEGGAALENNLASVLARLGRWDEALEHYRAALRLDPGNERVRLNLAGALAHRGNTEAQAGRWQAARASYEAALEIHADDASTHNNLATVLARLGELEDAAEHLREALRLDPDHPDARRNLAAVLEVLGGSR